MKRKSKNAPRQMWNRDEDKELTKIVNKGAKMTWNQVAIELARKVPKTTKTGKQCRERFRNYLNPELKEKAWTKEEKVLFLLLHCKYGNHWGEISKFYTGKSDISIKNLFYSYFRRTLKKFKDGTIPVKVIQKPRKTLEAYHALDLIEKKYLPVLTMLDGKLPEKKHEKIILQLVTENDFTEMSVKKLKSELIREFKKTISTKKFPILIKFNLKDINLDNIRLAALKSMIETQTFGELSKFLRIETQDEFDEEPQAPIPVMEHVLYPQITTSTQLFPVIPGISATTYVNGTPRPPIQYPFNHMEEYSPMVVQTHSSALIHPMIIQPFSYTFSLQNQQDFQRRITCPVNCEFNYGVCNEHSGMNSNNQILNDNCKKG